MWGLVKKGFTTVATGKTQSSLGLQSPHLPTAFVRVGRFLYTTSAVWIGASWYTGYVNKRTSPGSGPTLIIPGSGKPIVAGPDRATGGITFSGTSAGAAGAAIGAAAKNIIDTTGQASDSTQFLTTPNQAGRQLIPITSQQLNAGVGINGFLWTVANNKKLLPPFDRNRYNGLLPITNKIANQFGLRISSGYRPQSSGSLHASGLAFDLVGGMTNMKRAAVWASKNPAVFQEIFIHNEGSGLHLHLGFYPDAAGIFTKASNRMVRPTARKQVHPV